MAHAAVFVVPDDAELVAKSPLIVVGRVYSVQTQLDDAGEIVTVTTIFPSETLKGRHLQSITVTEEGGLLQSRALMVSGVPNYWPGEQVLVFIDDSGVPIRTYGMMLGKFSFVQDQLGRSILMRGLSHEASFDTAGNRYSERARRTGLFLQYIRDLVHGRDPLPDYFEPDPDEQPEKPRIRGTDTTEAVSVNSRSLTQHLTALSGRQLTPTNHVSPMAYLMGPMRWSAFDTGGAASFRSSGRQPGYDDLGAAQRGLAAWSNDPGSNINMQYAGTTNAGFVEDGVNAIVFNAASGVPDGAIAYSKAYGGVQHTFKGETYYSIYESDVIVKSGLSVSQAVFDEAVTHELGHSLGFRHSNEGTPASNDAVMYYIATGNHGSNLAAWDREAANHVYGDGAGAPSCTAPVITSQPASITAPPGQVTTLTVTATGTSVSYQWYVGASGNTASPIPGATSNRLAVNPNTTTSYWARVSNSCGAVNSATATVTVQVSCTPPTITAGPSSVTAAPGQISTLAVSATGTALSYQWYTGTSPNTASPIPGATGNTLRVNPYSTTAYWVRVFNNCGSVNSATAVVTVVSSCTPPSITSQPASITAPPGQVNSLSVSGSGTSVTYQWFTGTSGNTSSPIPGATSSTLKVNPNSTTSYWVRLSNACGTVNSSTATVTVAQACTAPAITAQPKSVTASPGQISTLAVTATGTSLTYQWYTGTSGNTSSPIAGATRSTLHVNPYYTTSYWVRVSNGCGSVNSVTATVTVR
jgi:Asp/Glu/hydantoin racemase